MSDLLL